MARCDHVQEALQNHGKVATLWFPRSEARQRRFAAAMAVYAHDGYRCQCCGARCTISELTYDHVVMSVASSSLASDVVVCLLPQYAPDRLRRVCRREPCANFALRGRFGDRLASEIGSRVR